MKIAGTPPLAIFLVLLLGATQVLAQVTPPATCGRDAAADDLELRSQVIPKLELLQQVLTGNFSAPPRAPVVSAFHNVTQDTVIFSIESIGSWATQFRLSYNAEVALVAPTVSTYVVPAIDGDDFVYRATVVLSGSNNFVRNTRYFFSAISLVNHLNQQSNPSKVGTFDFLPEFAVDTFTGTIDADKSPLPLDVVCRNFPAPDVVVTLIYPAGNALNLTYGLAPDDKVTGRLSTVYTVRLQIPSLTVGGTFTLRFTLIRSGVVVSRTLNVRAPFRPSFAAVFPPTLPLAGGIVRVLLSNVIYPLLATSTFIVNGSAASLIESSPSGPQDFFVTFNLPNVSTSSSVTYFIIPNGEPKATVSFSVAYNAVRVLSSSPPSFFKGRPSTVTLTIAVDTGANISGSVQLTLTKVSDNSVVDTATIPGVLSSALSVSQISTGVFAVNLNFAAGTAASLDVGEYRSSLVVASNPAVSANFQVLTPPNPSMTFVPSRIFDDTEYAVTVTVSNIGDIVSSTNLVTTCSAPAACRCSVAQFSISFASLNCFFRGQSGQSGSISFTVNNTNVAGFGVPYTQTLQVSQATSPRFVTASSTVFTSLGRSPIAVAVANFARVDDIKVAGVSVGTNIMRLSVVQPFNSKSFGDLQTLVKTAYPSEPIFWSAFDSVASNFQSNFLFNATICVFRMPLNANASASGALVEIFQNSPSATVSVALTFAPVLNVPIVQLSVTRISLAGATPVTVNVKNYIPITQISDIDIVYMPAGNATVEVSMKPILRQVSTTDATFSFDSPALLSAVDAQFKIVSKIDNLFGRTNSSNATQIVLFSLPVFDPRSLSVQSFSQKFFYSIGGPRIVTFFVNFLKVVPVSVTVNSLDCDVLAAPSLADIKLQPNNQFAITVAVKDFSSSTIGDVTALIFSGTEQANATLTVIALPTNPVLVAQQGNDLIPSDSSQRVTLTFRNFIASANTSRLVVTIPSTGQSISVNSADVSSDFTLTTLSFTAPANPLGNNEPSRTIAAYVADLSSGCGRNLTCVGNFTLKYINTNFASFVAMSPTSGAPSIVNSVVFIVNNVRTKNISLVSAEVTTSNQKSNVLLSVSGASFAGVGLSSQSAITLFVSWIASTRPADISVDVNISLTLDSQIVVVPIPFVFLPDNRPQLLSISPSSVSIDGGAHSAAFIQPSAYGFVSGKVFIDEVEVNSVITLNGSAISFTSPRILAPRTSILVFAFQGKSPVNITSTLSYTSPAPIVVSSVFPAEFSSFGSSSQVTLQSVPTFWTLSSVRASLVSGITSVACQVTAFTPSSASLSISCPALNVGFYGLELSDVSAPSRIAKSAALTVFNPLAPKFRSILPSQIFMSKSTQMSVIYDQYPFGSTPTVVFIAQGSTQEVPVQILSVFLDPSTTSSTVATILVNSPVAMASFSVKLSVQSAIGTVFTTSSPFINTIDDSSAAVLSVRPASINSVGGLVEVRVTGYPSGVIASDISATFTVNGLLSSATVTSLVYTASNRVTLNIQFPAVASTSSASYDVTIKPKGYDSKSVIFSLAVVKVSPIVSSVIPSSVLDSGGEIVTIRIAFLPVITSAGPLSVSIGGIAGSLPITLVSSTPDVTTISLTTAQVSIPSSGNFSLLFNYVLSPSFTISSIISIQVTQKILFVPDAKISMNGGSRALIPFTIFFPLREYNLFQGLSPGQSFTESTIAQNENLRVIVRPKSSPNLGSLVPAAPNALINIIRKDFPFKGCITFGVTFAAAAVSSSSLLAGTHMFSVKWDQDLPELGVVSVDILSRFMSLSPSSGALSGGYAVALTVAGLQSFASASGSLTASVFFGNSLAVVLSQGPIGSSSSFLFKVTCPSSTSVSDVDVSVRVNDVSQVSSKFSYTLGCLDYVAFCGGLTGGYIANALLIARDPPSGPVCSVSYCSVVSSIPAPVLVVFPRKQSTQLSTIGFTVKTLFAVSASQIRVLAGSDGAATLLAVQTAVYSADSDSFSITVRSPDVSVFSTYPIIVYSALVGIEKNATFAFTSVPPISGPVRFASIVPSIIPFEGSSVVSIQLTNFPLSTAVPTKAFLISASIFGAALNVNSGTLVAATLIASTEFGSATVQVTIRPSLALNSSLSQVVALNLAIRATSNGPLESASVAIPVNIRLPRMITGIVAANSISSFVAANSIPSTTFRSIAGTSITVAAQGFTGPNVTVCMKFHKEVGPAGPYSCEFDCTVAINAVDVSRAVSFLVTNYSRNVFNEVLMKGAAFGTLSVNVFDTNNKCDDQAENFKCSNCIKFLPDDAPSLLGSPPATVPFAQFINNNISGTEVFLSFSNFYNSTSDSISARVGLSGQSGADVFPKPDAGCLFSSCRVKVILGGNKADAELINETVTITFTVSNPQKTATLKVETKYVAPSPTVVPSLVSSAGGATITVTSFAFSQLLITNQTIYSTSNSLFSIIGVSKVGIIGTAFVLQVTSQIATGAMSVRIFSTTTNSISDSFNLFVFPALSLSNPPLDISACQGGDRRVQVSVSNLPVRLINVDLFAVKFNRVNRPFTFLSDSVFSISFPCSEVFPGQVLLEVSATISGVVRPASTTVSLQPLPINLAVQGTRQFRLGVSSTVTVGVDTLLAAGEFALDVVPSGKTDSVASLPTTLIRGAAGSSSFSFVFNPSSSLTPPGVYSFLLTVRSQSSKTDISVIDPSLSAVCVGSINNANALVPTCAINTITGGLFAINITRNGGIPFSSDDIVLAISRADGSPVRDQDLSLSLVNFTAVDATFFVRCSKYVVSSDFTSGIFNATLTISSSLYPSAKFILYVVFRTDPQVVSVLFDETLASLSVLMNQPIAFSSDSNCSRLFVQENISSLGDRSSCIFRPSSISVVFGSGATATVGDTLVLLPGSVSPADGFQIFNTAQYSSIVNNTESFTKPVVSLSGTTSVESCASSAPARLIALSASPRSFSSIIWSCTNCAPGDVSNFLSVQDTLSVSIPAQVIKTNKCTPDSPCGIFVTLVDFLGRSVVSPTQFVFANPGSAPDFQILPLSQDRYTPADSLSVKTQFKFSACSTDSGATPFYLWSIVGPSVINTTLVTGPFLNIRPNLLLPGLYTLSASVFIDGTTASARATVTIFSRGIVATISAPTVVSASKNFTLDARNSRDLETTAAVPLLFSWSCFDQYNIPCVDTKNIPLALPQLSSSSSSAVTIVGNTLPASADVPTEYFFRLKITNVVDSRVASDDVVVSVINDVVPSISASISSDTVNSGSTLPITLTATVDNTNLIVVWSEVTGLIRNFSSVIDPAFTIRSNPLVIKPSSFIAGQTYVFQAAVESDRRAKTTVQISVNSPPSSGTCIVSSVATPGAVSNGQTTCGIADNCNVRTAITVTCSNWADKELPLKYQYGYVSDAGVTTTFDSVSDSSLSLNLPIGLQTLFVNVCDNLFACTSVAKVNSIPLNITSARLDKASETALTDDASKLARSGNVEEFSVLLVSMISYFAGPASSGRRLLQADGVFVSTSSRQIAQVAALLGSDPNPGQSGTLIQTTSVLANKTGNFNPATVKTLLSPMVSLSGALLSDSDKAKSIAASKNIASIMSSMASADTVTADPSTFVGLRALENNMLSASLLGSVPGQQPLSVPSADGKYNAQAAKVLGSLSARGAAPVTISNPALSNPGASSPTKATFTLPLNMVPTADVSVRSSTQLKDNWNKNSALPGLGGNQLLTDLVDCTVFKDSSSVTSSTELGGNVGITIDFPLNSGSGTGSGSALDSDQSSFKLMYFDESTRQLSTNGCTGTVARKSGTIQMATFTGSCNHLSVFAVVASAPVVPGPVPGPVPPAPGPSPPGPVPTPAPAAPGTTPSPDSSSEKFPLWATIFIPVVGGLSLIAAAGIFIYKRKQAAQLRVKQIVAASIWKQSYASSMWKDVAKPPVPPSALPRSTMPYTIPQVSSSIATSTSPSRVNRQHLADLASIIALDEVHTDPLPHSRSRPRTPVTDLARIIAQDESRSAPTPLPLSQSRPRTPVNNTDYPPELASSLYLSSSRSGSPKPYRRDNIDTPSRFGALPNPVDVVADPISLSPPRSARSPNTATAFRTIDSSRQPRELPRSKSPYSNDDGPAAYSGRASPARFDPISLQVPGGKTLRQQLADMAAAAAAAPADASWDDHLSSSPSYRAASPQSSRLPRSNSRSRIAIADPVDVASSPSSPGFASFDAALDARMRRQAMADRAAAEAAASAASASSSSRPRSLSRGRVVLDDPEYSVRSSSPSTASPGRGMPSVRPPMSFRSALPSSTTSPSSRASPAASQRNAASPKSRQNGGSRYDQA